MFTSPPKTILSFLFMRRTHLHSEAQWWQHHTALDGFYQQALGNWSEIKERCTEQKYWQILVVNLPEMWGWNKDPTFIMIMTLNTQLKNIPLVRESAKGPVKIQSSQKTSVLLRICALIKECWTWGTPLTWKSCSCLVMNKSMLDGPRLWRQDNTILELLQKVVTQNMDWQLSPLINNL